MQVIRRRRRWCMLTTNQECWLPPGQHDELW